ncbi:MAG: 1-acyl-sn-glycerol-3-phosphate acyltransferase [Chlamydiales bacterium]
MDFDQKSARTTNDPDPQPVRDGAAPVPAPMTHRGVVYLIVMWVFVNPFYRLFYRVRVEGRENLPEGGALLAANHESFLDIPLVSNAAGPRHVAFVARDTLANSRILDFIMLHCGAVLLRRGTSDRKALRQMADHLRAGDYVGVFPEGTRSRDGQLGTFKGGVLLAAKTTGVPVVPIGIAGSFEIWPRHRKLPGRGRLIARIGKPIDVSQPNALEHLRAAIEKLAQ